MRNAQRKPRYVNSLEDVAVSWVLQALREEGLAVDDVWQPDRDHQRRAEVRDRPDCALLLDGEQAAIEVTLFETKVGGLGKAHRAKVRHAVKAQLADRGPGERSVLSLVIYEPDLLASRPARQLGPDADRLVEAMLAVARLDQDVTSQHLDQAALPDWVRGASVTTTARAPASVEVALLPPRDDRARRVDAFLSESFPKKRKQLADWGRGILTVVHDFDATAEDLREGIARQGSAPFWRVYWMAAGPPVELAWRAESNT